MHKGTGARKSKAGKSSKKSAPRGMGKKRNPIVRGSARNTVFVPRTNRPSEGEYRKAMKAPQITRRKRL